MIQIGPLEIPSIIVEAPIGVKAGRYRSFNIGERSIEGSDSTIRIRFHMDIHDPRYQQLLELVRNPELGALPIYTGYKYLNGLYNIRTYREQLLNWRTMDCALVIESAGHYFEKIQDTDIRRDDWNILWQDNFDSYANGTDIEDQFPQLRKLNHTTEILEARNDYSVSGVNSARIYLYINSYAVLYGFDHWKNYEFTCWMRSYTTDPIGIVWRAETGNIEAYDDSGGTSTNLNRGRHYALVVDALNDKYIVEYHSSWDSDDDVVEIIYEESHEELDAETFYKLGVITIGHMHYCFVNGVLITYFKDKRCKSGSVGNFRGVASGYIWMDDVVIRQVPHSVVVVDECYTQATSDMVKTRRTTSGQIGYCEDPAVTYKATSGGESCVLHLRFDQGYGEKVFDLSKYKNHAVITDAEWKVNFMRFTESSYITIPHDNSLNTPDEGTLVIRMRLNGPGPDDESGIFWKENGSYAWTMYLANPDKVNFLIDSSTDYIGAFSDPLYNISNKFQTYIIRWSKTLDRLEMFVDGICASVETSSIIGYGASNNANMVIGGSNIDIEYILLYNKWIEYPFLADTLGVKLYDVDTHHEDEVIDLRFDVDPSYVREYWNDLAITSSGVQYVDDAARPYNNLLYRRGGVEVFDPDYLHVALPDHIAGHFHEMNWTMEVIVAGNWSYSTDDYIMTLGDTSGTRTVALYLGSGDNISYFVTNQTNTQSGTIIDMTGSGSNTVVIQVVYYYLSRLMQFFVNGDLKVSLTLNDDLGTTSSHFILGKRVATGTGADCVFYRARIIASSLRQLEIEKIVDEYRGRPLIVLSQHEFKGYPMLDNGLLNARSIVDMGTLEPGERPFYELYDDGSFVVVEGDVSSVTEPLEVVLYLKDEEGNNHSVRLWDIPVLKSASQDEVRIELRRQISQPDMHFIAGGLHVTDKIEMSTGLFTLDNSTKINTRSTNWEIIFGYHDMQACWREGGWLWHDKAVVPADVPNMRGNFYVAAGAVATGYTMNGDMMPDHFMNHSIFMNLNYDNSSWSTRNFIIGVMSSHQDDYLVVVVGANKFVIEQFYFDDLQRKIGGEFRFSLALVPHSVSKHYSNEQNWTLEQGWQQESTDTKTINDNTLQTTGPVSPINAIARQDISYDPGSYKLFVNMFHKSGDPTYLKHMLMIYNLSDGYARQRAVWHNNPQPNDGTPNNQDQMWWDTDLVINDSIAKTLRTKVIVDADSNGENDEVYFDGLVIMPMYNGADYPLDQLYSARNLKQIKRYSK